jgi:erythromycin esterase
VENLGFTAIAIESSLPDSRRVDAYINGAAGNTREVARNHVGYGFGEFQATVELIEWMRAYNADRAHLRKLHFYGIDLPLGGADGGTPRRVGFVDPLTLLARADSAAAARLASALAPLLRLTEDSTLSASREELDSFALATDELLRRLERARPLLASRSADDADDYDWGYQSALAAHQTIWMHRGLPKAVGTAMPPGAWEGIETRDVGMANNVRWVVAREGPQGRVLVFAHNAHVANAANRGSVWDALAKPPTMMGVHLRSMFGPRLRIIAQVGGASADTAVHIVADTAGIDEALASVGLRQFALDVRMAQVGTPERRWLETARPLRANLTLHQMLRPIEAFDAVVFIDTLSPALRATRNPSRARGRGKGGRSTGDSAVRSAARRGVSGRAFRRVDTTMPPSVGSASRPRSAKRHSARLSMTAMAR